MAGHVLGMAQMVAALHSFVAQNAAAARAGGGVDALTAVQVRKTASLSAHELVDRFADVGPRAVRGRRRLSRALGRLPVPEAQVVGGQRERWTFGFLFDAVLTRDTWMHRTDISRAVGRELELTPSTTACSSPTWWPSGRSGTAGPTACGSPVPRVASGRPVNAGRSWSSTPSTSAACCSGRGKGAGLLGQQVPF